jgi:succinate dehydrogenase / fumarate reductase cytochrome b subunit
MSWLSKTLSSTIGRKLIMAVTGLFLVSFLFVHLIGNVALFYDDGGASFNKYSHFMSTAGIIRVFELLLVAGFLAHIWTSIQLTRLNNAARPEGYAYQLKPSKEVSWFSRNMGLSGSIVLIFLVTHLQNFYYRYHYEEIPYVIYAPAQLYPQAKNAPKEVVTSVDSLAGHTVLHVTQKQAETIAPQLNTEALKDMQQLVHEVFTKEWWFSILYVVAMFLLGFHLNHGFQSAFRTLGLAHKKYTPFLTNLGGLISILVPAGFASMPIYFLIKAFM